jgi:hypothetical protein
LKAATSPGTRSAPRRASLDLIQVVHTLLPAAALALGFFAMKQARMSAIGGYGLIQALPPLYYAALALAGLGFLLTWRDVRPNLLRLSVDLVTLVLLMQSPPLIIEPAARFSTAWLTAGFADYVAQSGHLLQNVDARFSWAGFFSGIAMLSRAIGLPSTILLLKWWPVALNLLYLPPFYLLARAILGTPRRTALAVWLFPLANWVGQDYFSPQSVGFLLYLVFVLIVVDQFGAKRATLLPRLPWSMLSLRLRWRTSSARPRPALHEEPAGPPTEQDAPTAQQPHLAALVPSDPPGELAVPASRPPGEPARPEGTMRDAIGLTALTVLAFAIIISHQITPIMAGLAVTLLAFFGRTRLMTFGILIFVFTAGWICYEANVFWAGHINMLFGGLGNVGSNVSQSVSGRFKGTTQHYRVLDVRLLLSAFVWALAAIGLVVGRRRKLDIRTPAILTITPFLVLGGGSYGGEAGLRVYLFSLAGALPLIAMLSPVVKSAWSAVAVACMTIFLVPAFVLSRWGNELTEMTQPNEITAVRVLYRIAPPGASLMAVIPQGPWRFADVATYKYIRNNPNQFDFRNDHYIVYSLAGNPKGGYAVITTSQIVYAEQSYGLPADWGNQIEQAMTKSGDFALVYSNPDAKIFELKKGRARGRGH